MRPVCVGPLVDAIGARLIRGERNLPLDRLAAPHDAGERDVCVVFDRHHRRAVERRKVTLVVLPDALVEDGPLEAVSVAAVEHPRLAFARATRWWALPPPPPGVHPSAVIDPEASVDPSAAIGPHVVVGPRARVEAGAVLGAGVHVGADAVIGPGARLASHVVVSDRCRVGARCVLKPGAVIGADGFGFASRTPEAHERIEQLGDVELEDDVEIGAHSCVDRATLGTTRVRRGAKIDNLVQVGHNVDIGAGVIMVAQSGIAGSSSVGKGAVIAAQAGVAGHVRVGSRARVLGQSGVCRDVPDGEAVAGSPAEPRTRHFRSAVALRKIEALWRRLRAAEAELEERTRT